MSTTDKSKYDQNIEALFKLGREKLYPKNQIVSYQGDPLVSIHMVKSGFLKAYTILDSGDTRTMFLLGAGDIFPIAFSLTMDWANYTVRYFYQTLTETSLKIVNQAEFRHDVETDTNITASYMAYMSASNQALMNQLEAMKHKTAKDKLLLLLPYLVNKIGQQIKPDTYKLLIKLSHQEVADLSGITRETTTSLLKELESEGIIKQKRDTWIIHLNSDLEDLVN